MVLVASFHSYSTLNFHSKRNFSVTLRISWPRALLLLLLPPLLNTAAADQRQKDRTEEQRKSGSGQQSQEARIEKRKEILLSLVVARWSRTLPFQVAQVIPIQSPCCFYLDSQLAGQPTRSASPPVVHQQQLPAPTRGCRKLIPNYIRRPLLLLLLRLLLFYRPVVNWYKRSKKWIFFAFSSSSNNTFG